LVENTVSNKVK